MSIARPNTSTHVEFYTPKDNSVNMAQRKVTERIKREIKSSHFNIGNRNGDMTHPKPVTPFQKDITKLSFEVDDKM
jgi:hypothetical protein